LCSVTLFFFTENRAVYEMSKSLVEPERLLETVWRRVSWWISKATRAQAHGRSPTPTPYTHTEWFPPRTSTSPYTHIACLVTRYARSSHVKATALWFRHTVVCVCACVRLHAAASGANQSQRPTITHYDLHNHHNYLTHFPTPLINILNLVGSRISILFNYIINLIARGGRAPPPVGIYSPVLINYGTS
jgi:hypothetical protein